MIVKNEWGLPQAFINALNLEKHNKKGEYSATTLLKGACEVMLQDRHFDEIEIDVADCVWQIFGTAVHAIFEKAGIEGFTEEKFSAKVSESVVNGRVDLYDLENEIIYDWKTASIYKCTYKDFDDWDKQGLTYAWLLNQNGLNVKEICFVALLKDHSKSKARIEKDYPQKPILVHKVKATEEKLQEIEKFIFDKVTSFEAAEKIADAELSPCSEKERWQSKSVYAVKKIGRKTALRLLDTLAQAEQWKTENGGDYIEYREGESRKCVDYCNCKDFCPYFQKIKQGLTE